MDNSLTMEQIGEHVLSQAINGALLSENYDQSHIISTIINQIILLGNSTTDQSIKEDLLSLESEYKNKDLQYFGFKCFEVIKKSLIFLNKHINAKSQNEDNSSKLQNLIAENSELKKQLYEYQKTISKQELSQQRHSLDNAIFSRQKSNNNKSVKSDKASSDYSKLKQYKNKLKLLKQENSKLKQVEQDNLTLHIENEKLQIENQQLQLQTNDSHFLSSSHDDHTITVLHSTIDLLQDQISRQHDEISRLNSDRNILIKQANSLLSLSHKYDTIINDQIIKFKTQEDNLQLQLNLAKDKISTYEEQRAHLFNNLKSFIKTKYNDNSQFFITLLDENNVNSIIDFIKELSNYENEHETNEKFELIKENEHLNNYIKSQNLQLITSLNINNLNNYIKENIDKSQQYIFNELISTKTNLNITETLRNITKFTSNELFEIIKFSFVSNLMLKTINENKEMEYNKTINELKVEIKQLNDNELKNQIKMKNIKNKKVQIFQQLKEISMKYNILKAQFMQLNENNKKKKEIDSKQIKNLQNINEKMKMKYNNQKEQIKNLIQEKQILNNEINSLQNEIKDKNENENTNSNVEIENVQINKELENENKTLINRNNNLAEIHKNLMIKFEEEKIIKNKMNKELKKKNKKLQKIENELENQIKCNENNKKQFDEINKLLKQKLEETRNNLLESRKELMNKNNEISALQSNLVTLKYEKKLLEDKCAK